MINILYLILFAGVILTGCITGSIWCFVAAAAMVIAVAVSVIVVKIPSKNVEFSLKVPAVVSKRELFRISASMETKSILPLGAVSYTIKCANRLTGEVSKIKADGMNQCWDIESAYCGCIDISLEDIRFHDWFDMFRLKGKQTCNAKVLVMPDTFELEASNSAASLTYRDTEEYSQDKKGQDRTETFRLRDYVPGDPLSQIHWKLSGKIGHLVIREASLPIDHSLVLFWEKSADDFDPASSDALCEAITSVASAYTQAGIPYTLVWNEKTLRRFEVAFEDQLPEAIASLLKAEAPDSDMTGAELYLRSNDLPDVGKIMYFTRQIPDMISELSETSEVKVIACGENAGNAERFGGANFTPETMEETLRDIILE